MFFDSKKIVCPSFAYNVVRLGGDSMRFNPSQLVNYFLCCGNPVLPMYKGHYITGKDISLFTKLMCVENTLTTFTCNCKGVANNIKGCCRNCLNSKDG